MLAQALQAAGPAHGLKISLGCFKKKNPEVYRLALQRLEGHEFRESDAHYNCLCVGTGCVYSMLDPGSEARPMRANDLCSWCDADYLEFAKASIEGRKRLNQALSAFKTNPEVYEAALAKVGADFVRASRLCCQPECIFSYTKPGERSRARRHSDLCFWCDPDVVSAGESTPVGIRKIAMDLRNSPSCVRGCSEQGIRGILARSACMFCRS